MNANLFNRLSAIGMRLEKNEETRQIEVFTDIGGIREMLEMFYPAKPMPKAKNIAKARELLSRREGGVRETGEMLLKWLQTGSIPMDRFVETKRRIDERLTDRINDAIELSKMKRRRVLSDCDGEYNPDRRGNDLCFETTRKLPSPERTLRIDAHFSVSWGVDEEALMKYAATIWAIVQIAESHGVACEVVRHNKVSGATTEGNWGTTQTIVVKKSGEYLAPNILAAALHPAMYRRAVWALRCLALGAYEFEIESGLGSPWQPGEILISKPGSLLLSSRVVQELPEHLEKVLIEKIIGASGQAAA